MNTSTRPIRVKTADLVLACSLLAASVGLFIALQLWSHVGRTVRVQVEGVTVATLPLDTDTVYAIEGVGGSNTLIIDNGKASVTDATCPDGVCVRHRAIGRAGESIICLPHKVVVTVDGEPPVDAQT